MNKKHQHHAKLAKPDLGYFGRNEISILGTPCGEIQRLVRNLSQNLDRKYKVAYVDADHKSSDDPSNLKGSILSEGVNLEYVDKIDFVRIDTLGEQSDFQKRQTFNTQDLVLVNGNHFRANRQIVIIDARKSLEKKLEKLTHVIAIIYQPGSEIPDYLKSHLPGHDSIPQFEIADLASMTKLVDDFMTNLIPGLNGLVLSGGKSERMQRDKTVINYHGKGQKEYMFDLMKPLVSNTYYSIREDQKDGFKPDEILTDRFIGLGPYGAILSAMMHNPDMAWMVTAADQPFLDAETLELLVEHRNPSKVATAFYNPETDFPEPLVTIWEPRAYPILLNYLSQGYSCPRKVLINSEIELIKLDDASVLDNVNTPEEYETALKRLSRTAV